MKIDTFWEALAEVGSTIYLCCWIAKVNGLFRCLSVTVNLRFRGKLKGSGTCSMPVTVN